MTQFLGNKEVRRLIGLMAALCIVCLLYTSRAARAFYERAGLSPDGERRLEPGTDKYLLRYAAAL